VSEIPDVLFLLSLFSLHPSKAESTYMLSLSDSKISVGLSHGTPAFFFSPKSQHSYTDENAISAKKCLINLQHLHV